MASAPSGTAAPPSVLPAAAPGGIGGGAARLQHLVAMLQQLQTTSEALQQQMQQQLLQQIQQQSQAWAVSAINRQCCLYCHVAALLPFLDGQNLLPWHLLARMHARLSASMHAFVPTNPAHLPTVDGFHQ